MRKGSTQYYNFDLLGDLRFSKRKPCRSFSTGFTLIELLIVIGIVAILMGMVIIAVNPGRQFAIANNSRRWANITVLLDGVSQNVVDNRGIWTCAAGGLPSSLTNMADPISDPAGYDICSCLVPKYIAILPVDPTNGSYTDCATYNTAYSIAKDPVTGRITVSAPNAQSENGTAQDISVIR